MQISRNKREWHKWFALVPVFVGNQISDEGGYWVWLEEVERRQSRAFEGRFMSAYVYRRPGMKLGKIAGWESRREDYEEESK